MIWVLWDPIWFVKYNFPIVQWCRAGSLQCTVYIGPDFALYLHADSNISSGFQPLTTLSLVSLSMCNNKDRLESET